MTHKKSIKPRGYSATTSLKRRIVTRRTIHGENVSASNFARPLSLKTRSGLSLRSARHSLRMAGGPSYRKKFTRKHIGV